MGPGPPITAMAIADAIFDEIRNSGTDVKKPESTRPHGVAPHPQLPRSNTKTKRTKPKRRRRRRRASVPTVDRTPPRSLTSSGSRSRAPFAVTDRQLELLAFVFDAKHLENSLVMYQKRAVKKLVAVKSGRTCWQVRGKSGAKEEYLVFPTHYCSCRAFQWDVLSKGEQLICKHMLAVRVAEALDDYNVTEIDDALLAQLLEAYANDVGDGGGGTRRGLSRRGGAGAGTAGGVDEAAHDHAVATARTTSAYDDRFFRITTATSKTDRTQNLPFRLPFFGALNPRGPPPS